MGTRFESGEPRVVSLRPIAGCGDPYRALVAALAYFPDDRWSAPTIAAAMSLQPEKVASLTPERWAHVLDRIEHALASVTESLDARNSESRAAAH